MNEFEELKKAKQLLKEVIEYDIEPNGMIITDKIQEFLNHNGSAGNCTECKQRTFEEMIDKELESARSVNVDQRVMLNFADVKIEIARMIDEYERKRISSNDRPTRISFEGSIVALIDLRDNLSKISV